MDIARQQVSSDCFISSANAITLAGQLVNIDYLGNRVASMVCGPKRVVLFIGINKIVDTVESALARVKNVACPMDSKRTNKGTSCEKIGYCVNCNTENSICTITTIIERKPLTIDYTIILLPFEIGF
jgi:hypothetical protein